MNNIQDLYFQSYVLFYADYLSLRDTYIPITDNCKYYYILGMPINVTRLVGYEPVYNKESKYYIQAYQELDQIRNNAGLEALSTFIRDLCNVFALGCINGEQMLKCILCYDNSKVRKKAINKYKQHMKDIQHTHVVKNDDGDDISEPCSKYVHHVDQRR